MASSQTHNKHLDTKSLTFSMYSSSEIRKLSIIRIFSSMTFNSLGHPLPGGLYDLSMGPYSEKAPNCSTCFYNFKQCPGHIGHIELPLPVVNPLYYKIVFQILKISCLTCHIIVLPSHEKDLLITQMKLLDKGYLIEAKEVEKIVRGILKEIKDISKEELALLIKEKLSEYYNYILKTIPKNEFINSKNIQAIKNDIINSFWKNKFKMCTICKNMQKLTTLENKIFTTTKDIVTLDPKEQNVKTKMTTNTTMIMPQESKEHLNLIFKNEKELFLALVPMLKNSDENNPCDLFFLDVIPVLPPRTRPVQILGNRISDNTQTQNYKSIIESSILTSNILKAVQDGGVENLTSAGQEAVNLVSGESIHDKLHKSWLRLQSCIDCLLDESLSKSSGNKSHGLKQIIEKKEGCIRMHMMGKRVNHSARSVITPDPNLAIDEVGVPEVVALKLTYPSPVTDFNVEQLRKMVKNGPLIHPGAVMIENSSGKIIKIHPTDASVRETLAKKLMTPGEAGEIKIVHRQLINGDVLLMNRQPSLHRPSIMAHKARILKNEKTFRIHYANCKAYNADFDGDEMNAHFPQNELARAEAFNLVNVNNQYLVPKDGTPLSGLIQDHVIGGVKLSMRGRFFTKEEYHELIFQGLANVKGRIKLLPPTILKPRVLWSGKQVISTLIINIIPKGKPMVNLTSTAKISSKAWISEEPRPWKGGGTPFEKDSNDMTESEVVIRQGELVCGVLEKNHYGATPYGLVHCLYELYGGKTSANLLSAFSKTFMFFLQWEGFSLGVQDILVLQKADNERNKLIEEINQIGDLAASKALNKENLSPEEIKEHLKKAFFSRNPKWRGKLDSSYKSFLDDFTNKINKACLPDGLISKFPDNNLQLMVHSGAKGSTVNTMQISCLLGQIELEGKRPPLMISGKALPSFPAFDTSPKAGGFIASRFMTGIQPQEFFFHCMAGREGLIDTAVKTSRSGYLQRCLIKHLEGLSVHYDQTVRDSDGSVIQFKYGEDGQDICKTQFLNSKQLPFLLQNVDAVVEGFDKETVRPEAKKEMKKIKKWKKSHENNKNEVNPVSGFSYFSSKVRDSIKSKELRKIDKKTGRPLAVKKVEEMWRELNSEQVQEYNEISKPCPNPLSSTFRTDRDYGVITENLENLMNDYIKKTQTNKDTLKNLLYVKSLKSQCPAGEPVGILAAQSIGEPSTQMTLNTFHFAGRGEMNVTLGIPRLREILMMASINIKTPSMEIPFIHSVSKLEKKANKLRRQLNEVLLEDVLENVDVHYYFQYIPNRAQIYKLRFNFLPKKAYKKDFTITPDKIVDYFEKTFLKFFLNYLTKKGGKKVEITIVEKETKQKVSNEDEELDCSDEIPAEREKSSALGEEHESSDEDPEGDDDDATMTRTRNKHKDNQDYDDPEEEDEYLSESQDENGNEDEMEETNPEFLLPPQLLEAYHERRKKAISIHNYINDYDFDSNKNRWCEVTLAFPFNYKRIDIGSSIKEAVKLSKIKHIFGIRRAFLPNDNEGLMMLKTEGINILEMFNYHKLLDLNKLYTNDIHKMSSIYGIEAAQRVIVKEIQMVFNCYGILVDPRHLLMIADYMTYDGIFRPMSRKGMEINISPLHQMSFESSLNFLRSSALSAKEDSLISPSSRIMVGRPCTYGTGSFTLRQNLSHYIKNKAR